MERRLARKEGADAGTGAAAGGTLSCEELDTESSSVSAATAWALEGTAAAAALLLLR